ncbi:MAG TPA: AIR synthase-related protein, partial [Dehalococcoidia bacterium]|nr:AIR synthase-related protein [Dehalococcoidia bacterium]
PPGEFDLVGFVVGAVEREALIDGSRVAAGDRLLALPSSGLHTNGYSLVRSALNLGLDPANATADRQRLQRHEEELGETLAAALLRPHRCYVNDLKPVLSAVEGPALSYVKAIAHITGGGIEENLPRVLPANLGARVDRGAWEVPPLFRLIQRAGGIDEAEMWRVFNMGLGLVIAVAPSDVASVKALVPEAFEVGEVTETPSGGGRVTWA